MTITDTITLKPIGYIQSEHTNPENTPIQPVYAKGCKGRAVIYAEYQDGLRDLQGFSHIHIIYWFHKSRLSNMLVKPFLDAKHHGLFATRTPHRPNPIGLSLVRLTKRKDHILYLEDVDMLDGTPILDIKPYISRFDIRKQARSGWQDAIDDETANKKGQREKAN